MSELVLILVLALIIFGPGKLPDVGKSLGKTIREFRSASRESFGDVTDAVKEVKEDIHETRQTLDVVQAVEPPDKPAQN
ncbi:MAG: twin-arginine translocase TatA/TatE family subunit [Candidatus Desulforudis sp.]|nr:twin-arginine translocase TatA/TatE family subunit [Desulforudis sp.]